ncbi:MAG TPA: FAD-dependent oxidoreductase [Terriglobales bacterium]|nr:FAD-dependent oxidoreductase [Terriglobales bacterium]
MRRPNRREFVKTGAMVAVAAASGGRAAAEARPKSAIVVGAGAFGGWTALNLLRAGWQVTILDAWGPGNSRASSGGETRVIRATYGASRLYTRMAVESLAAWKEHERRVGAQLFHRTGALWMAGADDAYERAALPVLAAEGVAHEKLEAAEAAKRWPQISFAGVEYCLWERDAGYLLARRACATVLEQCQKEGGTYQQAEVFPGVSGKGLGNVTANGKALTADAYVFACGPWLNKLFPDLGPLVHPTRQEVLFFGVPAGDPRYTDAAMPVWIDNGPRLFYGIPGNEWRGFKLADDTRGHDFDPTTGERRVSEEGVKRAREYMEMRFPGMRGAPLVESRVCQYENSPDQDFILDRHPAAENVWLVGGGSGHGFKHGPAMGKMVAEAVTGKATPPKEFALARLKRAGGRGTGAWPPRHEA